LADGGGRSIVVDGDDGDSSDVGGDFVVDSPLLWFVTTTLAEV
jgi:hypothetical protein